MSSKCFRKKTEIVEGAGRERKKVEMSGQQKSCPVDLQGFGCFLRDLVFIAGKGSLQVTSFIAFRYCVADSFLFNGKQL